MVTSKMINTSVLTCLSLLAIPQASSSADYGKSAAAETSEFKYQELKKYQPLPDVPQYSGQADFMQGVVYPTARGGSSTTYNLAARESKDTVIRWYQDALKMYKWNFSGEQSKNGVRCFKGGAFVQILVSPPARQGYGCDIVITYRTVVQ